MRLHAIIAERRGGTIVSLLQELWSAPAAGASSIQVLSLLEGASSVLAEQ
jgi:hypothetical protein